MAIQLEKGQRINSGNGEWKFNAVGEATKDRDFENSLQTVKQNYL